MINPFWSRVLFRELGPWWTGPLLWDRYCSLSFRSLVFLSYLEAPKKTRRRSRWGKQNSWKLVKPNIAETVATTLWYTSKGSLEFAWISVSQGSMSVSTFCCRVFSTFLFVLIIPILNFADAMDPNLPRWTNVTKKNTETEGHCSPLSQSRDFSIPGIPRGPRSHQKVQAVSRGVSCGGYWPSWTLWSWQRPGGTRDLDPPGGDVTGVFWTGNSRHRVGTNFDSISMGCAHTLDKNGSLYDPAGTESWNMQIRCETMKLTMHPTNCDNSAANCVTWWLGFWAWPLAIPKKFELQVRHQASLVIS